MASDIRQAVLLAVDRYAVPMLVALAKSFMKQECSECQQEREKPMPLSEIQRSREILRRMTSLMSSAASLSTYLSNLQPTSELSPELRSLVAATSAFLSLTTEALAALQYDTALSQST